MIAFFIARDSAEYKKYSGVEKQNKNKVGNPNGTMSEVIKSLDIKELSNEDLHIIVVNRKDWVTNLKDSLCRNADYDIAMRDFFGALKTFAEKDCGLRIGDHEVYVFCHWGAGGDASGVAGWDNAFQDVFTTWKANTEFEAWKVQAISSQRKDIFNVTDTETKAKWSRTHLPTTETDIKKLYDYLKAESEKYSTLTYRYRYNNEDFKDCHVNIDNKVPLLIIPVASNPAVVKLAGVIEKACMALGYNVIDVKRAPADKVSGKTKPDDNDKSDDKKDADSKEFFYPLFVDFEYDVAGRGRVRAIDFSGFMVPDEFVLRFVKDGTKSDANQTIELIRNLQSRIKAWESDSKLKSERDPQFKAGLKFDDLRDWMAGAFRRFCLLDEDVHGGSGNIDERELKRNPAGVWRKYKDRLQTNSNSSEYKALWEHVYKDEMETLGKCLSQDATSSDKTNPDEVCGRDFADKVVFKPYGSQVAYFSPVRKLSALLIDDDADNAVTAIKGTNVGLKKLDNIIDVEPVIVSVNKSRSAGTPKSVVEQAIEKFKEFEPHHKSYDFVLLDLRLDDPVGADPSGYQLIRVVRQFFPQIPIVIYSRYDDMGHISRAFAAGADWFIRKEDVGKLPRHLISLLSRQQWKKEWDALRNIGLCNDGMFEFVESAAFPDERKYLTYKVLENLPGKNIHVKTMGGGMSSAITFKAWKTVGDKGENLQNPVIVKIDSAFNTMTEYERYFRFIRPYIANECGRIEARNTVIDKDNSAIVYSFAGKNDAAHSLSTMKEQLSKDIKFLSRCDYEKYAPVLDAIFDDTLPKIHRVSPGLEIEEGLSSHPNPIFGEKKEDISKGGFIGNYLSRMPIANYYKVKQFVSQAFYDEKEENRKGVSRFEFHGICEYDGGKAIEAYEIENGYPKLTAILTGEAAKLVAKYRKPVPGQTLYVKVDKPEQIDKLKLDASIDEKIDERLAKERFFYGKKETDGAENKKVIRRTVFEELIKAFVSVDSISAEYEKFVQSEYTNVKDLLELAKTNSKLNFKCNVGIVHGDMNYANIMLDEKNGRPDKDVWLIDFARTRRDIIAHDFNVMFSATISLLFDNSLWNDEGIGGEERYAKRLIKIFSKFIHDVMMSDHDEEPDYVANDKRFTLVYKILRRIRKAALKDNQMTLDMYILTTALCCLYTFKIYLKHDNNIQAAAGFLAIAHICIEELKQKSQV